MSSQRGNVGKKGPPKHQNKTKFRNTLHDTSVRTKQIVSLEVSGVCQHCKDIVDWKIKYKKYKPLTTAKKCIKCAQKTVKRAYYIICQPCATSLHICAKCGKNTDVVLQYGLDPSQEAKQESEINFELRHLSERKRRAFLRMQEKGDSGRVGGTAKGSDSIDSCSDSDEDELESIDKGKDSVNEDATKEQEEGAETVAAEGDETGTEKSEETTKEGDYARRDADCLTRNIENVQLDMDGGKDSKNSSSKSDVRNIHWADEKEPTDGQRYVADVS